MTQAKSSSSATRVGIIGVGNWARHGHLRVLSLLPQYKIQAIFSQRRDAAERAAAEYDVPVVATSADELVNRPDVDLVVVLTTAPQHAEAVKKAIAAGKDVYCEWPLTPSEADSQELLDLAEKAGVRHVLGLQRRLSAHNRYLKDLLAQGYVGAVRSVRMHVSMNYFQAVRSKALAWTASPENGSSVIDIYAGHFLDMLFAATGWPVAISAWQVNQFPEVTIRETGEIIPTTNPDQLILTGQLADGGLVTVQIEGGKRNGSGVQIDITGTEGDIRITNRSAFGDVGDDYVIEGAHGDNLPLADLPIPASYLRLPESGLPSAVLELAELYHQFAEDLATGSRHAPDFRDAVRMHRLLDTAERSSESGQRQPLR